MKILHGENTLVSRSRFLEYKTKAVTQGFLVQDLAGADLTLAKLNEHLNSTSLFEEKYHLFIDQFFSRRPSKEKESIIKFVLNNPDSPIVFWDDKDVSLQVKGFPSTVVERFELPPYLFRFADTLTVPSFHQALTVAAPEQVMAILVRQLHNLILVKHKKGTFPAWQQAKLIKQAAQFSDAKLLKSYRNLLSIDFKIKNSLLPYDLTTAIEVWLVSLYHE